VNQQKILQGPKEPTPDAISGRVRSNSRERALDSPGSGGNLKTGQSSNRGNSRDYTNYNTDSGSRSGGIHKIPTTGSEKWGNNKYTVANTTSDLPPRRDQRSNREAINTQDNARKNTSQDPNKNARFVSPRLENMAPTKIENIRSRTPQRAPSRGEQSPITTKYPYTPPLTANNNYQSHRDNSPSYTKYLKSYTGQNTSYTDPPPQQTAPGSYRDFNNPGQQTPKNYLSGYGDMSANKDNVSSTTASGNNGNYTYGYNLMNNKGSDSAQGNKNSESGDAGSNNGSYMFNNYFNKNVSGGGNNVTSEKFYKTGNSNTSYGAIVQEDDKNPQTVRVADSGKDGFIDSRMCKTQTLSGLKHNNSFSKNHSGGIKPGVRDRSDSPVNKTIYENILAKGLGNRGFPYNSQESNPNNEIPPKGPVVTGNPLLGSRNSPLKSYTQTQE
jgi:hypothetical protein